LVLRDPSDLQMKIYGLPLFVDTLALYFNKGDYDDAIPSQGKPASTWEGLKDDVFKLTKKDQSFERFQVAGAALGRADNILRAIDILFMIMLQYKVNFYNDNISAAQFSKQSSVTATGTSINPAVEALRLYTSFALPSNKNYSWNEYLADPKSSEMEVETFAKGKVAMIFGYSYLYEEIKRDIIDLQSKGVQVIDPKVIQIAAVPQITDPSVSTDKRVAYANYYAETVSRTSANQDAAWDFLQFMTSKDNIAYYSQKTHRPTSRRDLIQDQIKDPIYGIFAQQIGFAESLPIYDYSSYKTIFNDAINGVLATSSADDMIKTAEGKISALLPPEGLIPPAPAEKSAAVPATSRANKPTSSTTLSQQKTK